MTLYHNDMPLNVAKKYHGFVQRETVDLFERYATTVFERYRGKVKYWLTFNEINAMYLPFIGLGGVGDYGDYEGPAFGVPDDPVKRFQGMHHILLASAKAVATAHHIDPNYRVGCMINQIVTYPFSCDPADVLATQQANEFNFEWIGDVQCRGAYPYYMDELLRSNGGCIVQEPGDAEILRNGTVDFYSFSYYSTNCLAASNSIELAHGNIFVGGKNPHLKQNDWGWQIDADGLYYALNTLYARYGKPLMVVENGLGAVDELVVEDGERRVHDPYRIEYLREHVKAMKRAVERGVDLIGYTSWGWIDLISASDGTIEKRYGYVYVDMDAEGNGTKERIRKDSFDWYKQVIATNGEDLGEGA